MEPLEFLVEGGGEFDDRAGGQHQLVGALAVVAVTVEQ